MTKNSSDKKNQTEQGADTEETTLGDSARASNSEQEDSEDSEQAAELPGVLEKILPEDVKANIPNKMKRAVGLAFSMESRREVSSPFIDLSGKIQPSHITQFLQNDAAQDERAFQDSQISKKYTFGYVIVFCLLFVFITVFLVDRDVSVYTDLLRILIIFGGGFGSGIGYKTLKDRKNKS